MSDRPDGRRLVPRRTEEALEAMERGEPPPTRPPAQAASAPAMSQSEFAGPRLTEEQKKARQAKLIEMLRKRGD